VDSDGAESAGARSALSRRADQAHTNRGPELTGTVTELLPSGLYRVRVDEGSSVVAHIADRIDRNFVRVLVGDRVRIELSAADTRRGRIVGKVG
jgi:translation initiation factor IF-1